MEDQVIPNLSFVQALHRAPDLLKSIYTHDETVDLNIEICDKYKLSDAQTKSMLKLLQLVVMQTIKPQDIPERIKSDLLLDMKNGKEVAIDLLGLRILPLEWFVGPVQPVIRNLGGDPEKYLKRLRPIYPEVYSNGPLQLEPKLDSDDEKLFNQVTSDTAEKVAVGVDTEEILADFEKRLSTFAGRAEILFRLTGLASRVEDAVKDNRLSASQGEQMITDLDSISSAINTRDLNPFEVEALKRRLTRLLTQLTEALK